MSEIKTNIFENRILLFMDILGSREIVSAQNTKSLLIKEIITSFSCINKPYSKYEVKPKPEECDLIKWDKPFTQDHINELPGVSERAYVREGNSLYYVIKRIKKIDRIDLQADSVTTFDREIIGNLEFAVAKKLTSQDFERIENITRHKHSIGIISIGIIEPEISSFSDHIALSLPIPEKNFDLLNCIFGLFRYAIWLHHLMLRHGFLMRGAMTLGDLFHEGNIITGDALNRAVDIEEKLSVYPRVIVENEIIKLLPSNKRYFLKTDFDGLNFVDYLSDKKYFTEECILELLPLVNQNISDNSSNMRVYSKWFWLLKKMKNYFYSKIATVTSENIENES